MSWASFASHFPVLLLAAFLVFLYLLCLCGISHTLMHRCSLLIPLPLGPVFMIQDSKAIPHACPELREQQKDVSVAVLPKTWASICIVPYIVHCGHTQLRFLSHTSDLVMHFFWLKCSAASAMLNCILKLSWVKGTGIINNASEG